MNILFVLDPVDHLNPEKDNTIFLMNHASTVSGQKVYYGTSESISRMPNGYAVECRRWVNQNSYFHQEAPQTLALATFDRIFIRKEPPFDVSYLYLTILLQNFQKDHHVIIQNDPSVLQRINEKLAILYFPDCITDTLVSCQKEVLHNFVDQHETCVIKKLDGMQGNAVFKVEKNDTNKDLLIAMLSEKFTSKVMMQKYLPEIHEEGDTRVLIVNNEVVPIGLKRMPSRGNFRANLGAGGSGQIVEISPRQREIAVKVTEFFRKESRPIGLVGLDIIGNHLNEINITCVCCLKEIDQQTDNHYQLAQKFIASIDSHQ